MPEPIILPGVADSTGAPIPAEAVGHSFGVSLWSGSGPDYLHVHHADDEAWHILEGTLTFRFPDREVEARAGTTIFVPAGVPHTYFEASGPTRYLLILTPRLRALIDALHASPYAEHAAVLRRFESELVG